MIQLSLKQPEINPQAQEKASALRAIYNAEPRTVRMKPKLPLLQPKRLAPKEITVERVVAPNT
jgi:hypothetical protein